MWWKKLGKIAPICAAAELINISSYQANLSFGEKYGLTSRAEKHNQFIASVITREIVADIIHGMTRIINYAQAEKIGRSLAESNRHIYLGQLIKLKKII